MPNPAENDTLKDNSNATYNFFPGQTVKDLYNAIKATNKPLPKASSNTDESTAKNALPSNPMSDEEIAKKNIKDMSASDMARLLKLYSKQNEGDDKSKELPPCSPILK